MFAIVADLEQSIGLAGVWVLGLFVAAFVILALKVVFPFVFRVAVFLLAGCGWLLSITALAFLLVFERVAKWFGRRRRRGG